MEKKETTIEKITLGELLIANSSLGRLSMCGIHPYSSVEKVLELVDIFEVHTKRIESERKKLLAEYYVEGTLKEGVSREEVDKIFSEILEHEVDIEYRRLEKDVFSIALNKEGSPLLPFDVKTLKRFIQQ